MATAAAVLPFWWHLTLVAAPDDGITAVFRSVAVYPADVLLATLIGWRLVGVSGEWRRSAAEFDAPALALGLLALLAATSAIVSPEPLVSLGLALHLGLLALAWWAARSLGVSSRWIAVGLAASALPQALLAIAQVASQQPLVPDSLNLPWLPGADLDRSGEPVLLGDGGQRFLRGFGTFPHPNLLGGYLALAIAALPCLATSQRARWIAWIVGLLLGGGLLATFSRAAWGAALVALAVWWARGEHHLPPPRQWLLVAAAASLGALLIALAGPSLVLGRLWLAPPSALERASVDDRLRLVEVALGEIRDHPVLGTGAGAFGPRSLLDGLQEGDFGAPVHVVPLLVTAELGLPGLAALGLLVAGLGLGRVMRGDDPGGPAILAALVVLGLLDHYLWTMPPGRVLAWLALVLVATAAGPEAEAMPIAARRWRVSRGPSPAQ